jgi:hypothetical protein
MSALHTVPIVQACSLSGTTLTIGFDPEKLTRGGDTLTVQPYNRSNPGSSALELLFKGAGENTMLPRVLKGPLLLKIRKFSKTGSGQT